MRCFPSGTLQPNIMMYHLSKTQTVFHCLSRKSRWRSQSPARRRGHDFPDRLFAAHWQGARAWGIVEDGKLLGAIELCAEEWSNRLRVTELWVDPSLQKLGYGHALMEIAKQQARLAHRRALILETQSANANAIGFYLHEGFELIGLDLCCYTNCDIRRKDVRLELGWFPQD